MWSASLPEGGTVQLLAEYYREATCFSANLLRFLNRRRSGIPERHWHIEVWAKSLVPFDPSSIEVQALGLIVEDGTEIPM